MLAVYELPWPPSVNRMWRTVRIGKYNRTLLSEDGRRYHDSAAACAARDASWAPETGPVVVVAVLVQPDNRRRDVDNFVKGPLDSIKGIAYEDDSQIVALDIRKLPPDGGPGAVFVGVAALEDDQ